MYIYIYYVCVSCRSLRWLDILFQDVPSKSPWECQLRARFYFILRNHHGVQVDGWLADKAWIGNNIYRSIYLYMHTTINIVCIYVYIREKNKNKKHVEFYMCVCIHSYVTGLQPQDFTTLLATNILDTATNSCKWLGQPPALTLETAFALSPLVGADPKRLGMLGIILLGSKKMGNPWNIIYIYIYIWTNIVSFPIS